jgi:hypothetical protein
MIRLDMKSLLALGAERQRTACAEASADSKYRITVPQAVLGGVTGSLIDKAREQ